MEFYSAYKFSPPYGDGICWCNIIIGKRQFSPPYGDCTDIDEQLVRDMGLSSPYGDGTHIAELKKCIMLVFAPLRGWYRS